jgi:hypothetical protein
MKVRSLYAAFLLWPVGAGMLFAGLVPLCLVKVGLHGCCPWFLSS